jgi:hypothetical protein
VKTPQLRLRPLEARDTPALFVVQSLADTGPGTLRAALNQAALAPGADEVSVDAFGTIQLDTPLPDLGGDVAVTGPGAENLTVRPRNSNFNVFRVYRGVNVRLDGLTIQDGNAESGGGVFNEGNLHVANCAFDHNTARLYGGGLYNLNGTLQVFHSSFTSNVTTGAGGGYGGGVAVSGGRADLFQCTLTRNFGGTDGGGVMLLGGSADVKIDRCTIVDNRGAYDTPAGVVGTGGGIANGSGNRLLLHNTIVADNFIGTGGLRSDLSGVAVNGFSSYNLIGVGTATQGVADGVFGNHIGSAAGPFSAGLGPVSATRTFVLPPALGSTAINAGDPADLPGVSPAFDQRGRNRVVDGRIDIGAVEFQPPGVVLTPQLLPNPGSPQDVTLVARVAAVAAGSNPVTGEVRFYLNDFDNVLGVRPLAGGEARLDVPALPSGTVGVQYEGTGDFSAAQVEFPYAGGPAPGGGGGGGGPVGGGGKAARGLVPGPVLVGAGAGSQVATFSPGGVASPFDALPGTAGGVRVAAGDFNADGVADFAVGTGPGGSTGVRVLDGKTRQELFALAPFEVGFTGGVFVAAGDLNNDGAADLIVTPDEGGGPRVRVFSGKGFGQLADFLGIEDPNFRGGARAAAADVTGDGVADLLVAAGFGGGPRVAAFDGRSVAPGATPSRPFADFFAFEQSLRNGVFVAGGDLDGDGTAEVVAGAGPGGGPRVLALSGKGLLTGAQTPRANFFAGDPAGRGGVRVAMRDLDGDGRSDLVAGGGSGSRVTGYAGAAVPADGAPPELFAIDAFPGTTSGVFVG